MFSGLFRLRRKKANKNASFALKHLIRMGKFDIFKEKKSCLLNNIILLCAAVPSKEIPSLT